MTPSKPRRTAKPALNVDDLWSLDRIGAPSLSPDGTQVVCSVTRASMATNRSSASLWLMSTAAGRPPRRLTACGDKDAAPAWSPRGDRIAFLARREQQGQLDDTAQLYVIAPDGGEAERKSRFAPGIESFKWMPDGERILFTAWVWPHLKGVAAQQREFARFAARKTSGYATGEAYYRHWDHNLPMGRVLHLLLLDLRTGRIIDLFEGTGVELPRDAGGNDVYDPSPDGRRVAFVHDPAQPQVPGKRWALSELVIAGRKVRALADDPDWDFQAPCYRPDGQVLAMLAAHVGQRHTAPSRLGLIESGQPWALVKGLDEDLDLDAPLRWREAGRSVLFAAERRGRRHLWQCRLDSGALELIVEGGWVQGFDAADGVIVVSRERAHHPAQIWARQKDASTRRLETFNDQLLASRSLGEAREVVFTGALGEPVQMWLTFPPRFNPKRRHPVLQVLHGGPYAAAGDSFSARWNPHVLAARGHVVAQVNYHGSSGFGPQFRDSIMGRQGELELQDIEAASTWLLKQPWADRDRLSAAGGSYGGFLVAWMNGHAKPGRYRSYVCHAGVFDRIATFSADSYVERPRDLGARYWENLPQVLAQSPHSAAARMQTPTLVIHGALDYRVPDCNGLAYYNTLKSLGVDARLLWFPDENHWVLKPQNAKLWAQEFLDWVEVHDGAKRPKRRLKPSAPRS